MKHIFTISLLFLSFFGISQGNETCWLTSKTLQLPTVNQNVGNTLSVAKIAQWIEKNPINAIDKEFKKIINRGSKFFLIKQTKTLEQNGLTVIINEVNLLKSNN